MDVQYWLLSGIWVAVVLLCVQAWVALRNSYRETVVARWMARVDADLIKIKRHLKIVEPWE